MRVFALSEFPTAPALGTVTLEETEGHIYNEAEDPLVIQNYHKDTFPELPYIRVQDELSRPRVASQLSAKACILRPPSTDRCSQLLDSYVDHGVYGFLHQLATQADCPKALVIAAQMALRASHCTGSVYAFLRGLMFPQLQLSPEEVCGKYSEVANWPSGLVRAIAWHPNTKKLAIALRNDSVFLYSANQPTSSELKHPKQKNVTCVAFRPFSGSHIAVGCEQGLLLWNIAPSIAVKTPTMHSALVLLPGTLVSSLAWHPGGNLLAVCSARFGDIQILSPATGDSVPLTTLSLLPAAHLLRWAPDGFRLFAACPNGDFNIWSGTLEWDAQRFYTKQVVTAACWSHDGCQLIFAKEGSAKLYQLSLNPVGEPTATEPKPRVIVDLDGHPDGISGEVSLLQWERTCTRLAVAFRHPTPLIAVFQTVLKPVFSIKPLGFFRGPSAPEAMKFCDDYPNGALLTVCWSTGSVQHIPFHFDVASADRSVVMSRSAIGELSGHLSNDSSFGSR